MNPLRVWARGYRTFDELELEIPDGCTAVIGPNGAGKSSILNIVDVALFAGAGELADLLSTDHDELELGLEFEHLGERYRVRRQLRRGRSATLDLERLEEHMASAEGFGDREPDEYPAVAWMPLTREKVAATQQLIEETLGLTRTTFRASAFLRQGDSAAFTEAAPRDRKAILADILQLDRWEQRRATAAALSRGRETELATLNGRAEAAEHAAAQRTELDSQLAERRSDATEHEAAIATIEQQADETRAQLAERAAAKERVRACEAELQAAEADERRARDVLLEAQQSQASVESKQAELDQAIALAAKTPELEQQLADARAAAAAATLAREAYTAAAEHARTVRSALDSVIAEAERLEQEYEMGKSRIAQLEASEDEERCVLCEQLLGEQARAATLANMRSQVKALGDRFWAATPERDRLREEAAAAEAAVVAIEIPDAPDTAALEQALARAQAADARRRDIEQLLAGAREKAARMPLLRAELDQFTATAAGKRAARDEAIAQAGDTRELEQKLTEQRRSLDVARAALDADGRAIASIETQLQQVEKAEAELAEISSRRGELQAELDTLKLGEKAFGRDGVPALLVEAVAVPQLESDANRILEQLPMADGRVFRLELRTQAENKSNDNVRETLDIVVYDRGASRPYETFSGGEKTRLNLALRLALSQLLAHRRGADSRLLCIDEPDGLDADALDALAGVLQGLVGTFERILIVSHQAELASAFEQSLTVSCEHGRSRIGAGVQLETVGA